MSGNCVGLHPYGDCGPGVGCNAAPDPVGLRLAGVEAENVELRLHLHVAEELLAALREQGVCVPVLPTRSAVVRPMRAVPLAGGGW